MIIITIIINSNNNKNKNNFQKKWLLREDLVAPKCKATFSYQNYYCCLFVTFGNNKEILIVITL